MTVEMTLSQISRLWLGRLHASNLVLVWLGGNLDMIPSQSISSSLGRDCKIITIAHHLSLEDRAHPTCHMLH